MIEWVTCFYKEYLAEMKSVKKMLLALEERKKYLDTAVSNIKSILNRYKIQLISAPQTDVTNINIIKHRIQVNEEMLNYSVEDCNRHNHIIELYKIKLAFCEKEVADREPSLVVFREFRKDRIRVITDETLEGVEVKRIRLIYSQWKKDRRIAAVPFDDFMGEFIKVYGSDVPYKSILVFRSDEEIAEWDKEHPIQSYTVSQLGA